VRNNHLALWAFAAGLMVLGVGSKADIIDPNTGNNVAFGVSNFANRPESPAGLVLGFNFTVSAVSDITVTQLGVLDSGINVLNGVPLGLVDDHEVGLWNIEGTLLGRALVPKGTGASLFDWFRYADIIPTNPSVLAVTLEAGHTYTIGALYPSNSDPVYAFDQAIWPSDLDPTGLTSDPATTFGSPLYTNSSTLACPTVPDEVYGGAYPAFFGPNFQFYLGPIQQEDVVSVVPLPSSFWSGMVMVGLLGGWRIVRRRGTLAE
jgi:hypothetical protein